MTVGIKRRENDKSRHIKETTVRADVHARERAGGEKRCAKRECERERESASSTQGHPRARAFKCKRACPVRQQRAARASSRSRCAHGGERRTGQRCARTEQGQGIQG
eukprot:6184224-Pleurochrysis_carterae.AAC.1